MANWAFVVAYCIVVLVGLGAIAYGVYAWKQYRATMRAALFRRRERDLENAHLPSHADNYWAGPPPPPHAVPVPSDRPPKSVDYDIPHVVVTHL